MDQIIAKNTKNHHLLHMAMAGGLILRPPADLVPRSRASIGKYFDYIRGKVIGAKVPLPVIYSEAMDLIVDCVCISAMFSPLCGNCRLLVPSFSLPLPLVNYSNKH